VRALRTGQEVVLIVRLPDGFQLAVPRWMLDAVFCSQLPQEPKPRVALAALGQLVELMQAQGLPGERKNSESGASPSPKGNYAPRQQHTALPTEAGSDPQAPVGEVAGEQSSSLSRTVDPTAAQRGAEPATTSQSTEDRA
jgi:hypothetical protein